MCKTVEESKARPDVGCTELLGLSDEKRRADRLATNCKWLITQIDKIHDALCPDISGTWQQRATDSVAAARAIKRSLGEARGALHRIAVEIKSVLPNAQADRPAKAGERGEL